MKLTLTNDKGKTIATIPVDEAVILEDPISWSACRVTLAAALNKSNGRKRPALPPWLRPTVVSEFRKSLRDQPDEDLSEHRKSVKRALRIVARAGVDNQTESRLRHALNELNAELDRRKAWTASRKGRCR